MPQSTKAATFPFPRPNSFHLLTVAAQSPGQCCDSIQSHLNFRKRADTLISTLDGSGAITPAARRRKTRPTVLPQEGSGKVEAKSW